MKRVPVLVLGGGPVGLAMAALLARQGIDPLVVEARAGYSDGSRAICISRRSLEILAWIGADRAVLDKGLSWVGGRSYYRDREVLHFRMPSEPGERFPPMVNIQQYYVEQYVDEALGRIAGPGRVRWQTKVVALRPIADGVEVDLQEPDGTVHTLHAGFVVACDGGRSIAREALGLRLSGIQYDGRYVIVDIEQETARPTERLAWFDPPSNPGSTILMHRQPENVWRIDYQLADDEDAEEAVRPENVLPRVQSHLSMIGEDAPWKPLWITTYNAKCLTLERYRHGRVLFAGDAAHLVPIFGVRGLNSGLDDAGNLAWKLARVMRGEAAEALLDTYSLERVAAARENIAYGAKSTEFMAPPNFAFALMREATVRLAVHDPSVSSLINPRQSAPVAYQPSALTSAEGAAAGFGRPESAPGRPAPDAPVQGTSRNGAPMHHLSQCFGASRHVLLVFQGDAAGHAQAAWEDAAVERYVVVTTAGAGISGIVDVEGLARRRFGAVDGAAWLVRPDGYIAARWPSFGKEEARQARALVHGNAPVPAAVPHPESHPA